VNQCSASKERSIIFGTQEKHKSVKKNAVPGFQLNEKPASAAAGANTVSPIAPVIKPPKMARNLFITSF
jgi:hypothetical protein